MTTPPGPPLEPGRDSFPSPAAQEPSVSWAPSASTNRPTRVMSALSRVFAELGERVEKRTVLEGIARFVARQLTRLGERVEGRADVLRAAATRNEAPPSPLRSATSRLLKSMAGGADAAGDRLESRAARRGPLKGAVDAVRRGASAGALGLSEGLRRFAERMAPQAPAPQTMPVQAPTAAPAPAPAPNPVFDREFDDYVLRAMREFGGDASATVTAPAPAPAEPQKTQSVAPASPAGPATRSATGAAIGISGVAALRSHGTAETTSAAVAEAGPSSRPAFSEPAKVSRRR
ncbi:hypothetical protein QF030_000369 [Streptomyces rishiriensis]|uniref:Uncharacterized protein n=1 Tax=Streptomyces rishiriensis TaxID=68264 RepID=A0ABU0NGF3_STRRH|nr:hypothetical protein [Streptomyces rishiriensis]